LSTETFGRYQLIRKLAMGGMAEIYLAKQKGIEGFEKTLVVKRILPHLSENEDFVRMFRQEARTAARLNHANIAQIFDLGKEEETGAEYIAMEFIHGEDVRRISKQAEALGREIPLGLVMRIVADACAGLDYAHKHSDENGRPLDIVHRDVSPQNILVSFDGSVKVVDFGIAKAADQATVTQSGVLKGKYSYMSPEQAAGQRVDCRTDVFAIGVVLWELLTGARLFKRASDVATLNAVAECRVDPPSSVNPSLPPDVDDLVMRALARDLNERYQEALQLQVAIEDWLVRNQQAASSAHLAAFMQDLYAERLAEESRLSESGVGRSKLSRSLQQLREDENLKRPSGPKARLVSRQEEGVSSKEATSAVRPSRIRSGFTPSLRTATPSKREAPRQTTELRRPQPRFEDDDELDLPTNPMDAAEVAAVTRSHDPLRAERTVSASGTEEPRRTPGRAVRPSRGHPRPTSGSVPAAAVNRPSRPSQPRPVPVPAPEPEAAPARPRKTPWVVASLLLLVVAGVLGAMLFMNGESAPPTVQLVTDPPGAQVWFGDRQLCAATPCVLSGLTPPNVTLTISREGFQKKDVVVGVPAEGERSSRVQLEPISPKAEDAAPVAPPVEPKAPPAVLIVHAEPEATVFLDGKNVGETPISLHLQEAGRRSLKLTADGHRTHEETVVLEAGVEVSRKIQLSKIQPTPRRDPRPRPPPERAATGTVSFFVRPWAEVRCGKQNFGTTPFPAQTLSVGRHTCVFTNPQFDPVTRTIQVKEGNNPVVRVDFQ